MPGLEDLGAGIAPVINQLVYWMGYIIFTLLFLGICFFVIYIMQFRYKMTYWEVVGRGNKKGGLSIDKPKKNRVKWDKTKTKWVCLYPLFKNKTLEPFENHYIYPGRNVYAFKFGDNYIPAKIEVDTEDNDGLGSGSIGAIPFHIIQWQINELKQNEEEFSQKSWWDENKHFLMTVLTVAICCGLAGLTVYYTYKFATGGRQDIESLTAAIRHFGQVGNAPG